MDAFLRDLLVVLQKHNADICKNYFGDLLLRVGVNGLDCLESLPVSPVINGSKLTELEPPIYGEEEE
jgi:hypothetical protein